MKQILNRVLSRTGRDDGFKLDDTVSARDSMAIVLRLAEYGLRGVIRRMQLGSAKRVLLVGRRVRLLHASHIHLGVNCVIEDDVEIVGLARAGIRLGDNVAIGRGTLIKPTSYYGRNLGEGLQVGAHSSIGPYGYVGCSGFISIGANVLIGPRVSMHAENHQFLKADIPIKEQGVVQEPIVIEDDCWIGSDVVLLGGVTVGRGAVVAAGSVVTKPVADGSVVAGVPARVIGDRSA
jgi:acetyltransferase-like isoleucine patch superfamily enzyme